MTAPSAARAGILAALGMSATYVAVLWGASGSLSHVGSQARADWYFLALIVFGFGVQVALVSELRRRQRLQRAAGIAGGVGVGAAGAGMVACCAHHIADLAPLVGAAGAATFLAAYRVPFMVVGITLNAVGIAVALRALRRTRSPDLTRTGGARTWAHL